MAENPQLPFISAAPPPPAASLRAATPAGAGDAADAALRFGAALEETDGFGRGVSRKEAAAVPLLFSAPEGRAYRAASGPRAFALGDPPESCPARIAAGGASPRAAAQAAIRLCFEGLEAAGGADPDCGCRLVALDRALLGAPEDYAYASGVSARLISRDLDLDLDMVARERPGPEGLRRLDLVPAPGAGPARLAVGPDGEALLRLDEALWRGRRRAEGLSRGRFRERFEMRREDGARLFLAVGWDPVAYALARPDRAARAGD